MASLDPELNPMMRSQMRLMEVLSAYLASLTPAAPLQEVISLDYFARNISVFLYDPQADVSFETWYKRYEEVLTIELAKREDETKRIFRDTCLPFNAHFQCLQMVKRDSNDFVTHAGLVNRECDRSQLGSPTADQFRCLIFICGLKSPSDADLSTELLALIGQDPTIKLQQIVEECEHLPNLKHDSALSQRQNTDLQTIHTV